MRARNPLREKTELEHSRLVEAVDPQHRAGGRRCRARRHEAHQLRADDLRPALVRLELDPLDDLVERGGLEVLDVHRDLDDPGARQVEPERPDAREAAPRLADECGDLLGGAEFAPQVDVERDQRPPSADDHAARTGIELARAEIRLELADADPPAQLVRPAAAEERGAPARRQLAVEEDRQAELFSDPPTQDERRLERLRHLLRPDRHDRHDVRGSDPRMGALVPAQVDPLAGAVDPRQQRLDQVVGLAHEREHRPVMIGVDVDVKQPCRRGERGAQRLHDLGIATLGEVRHCLQHDSYSKSVKAYYEARAPEYDDWWSGTGLFADRDRPGWDEERAALIEEIRSLEPARTLDVACGTGFLTQYLPGSITGLDASSTSLEIAAARVPNAAFVESDALRLPFADGSFERVFTSHFYGHLDETERARFLIEARRLAPELVLVDSALRDDVEPEELQERVLSDGSRWQVLKRYFKPESLATELGGGETLFAGRWFVVVRAR